MAARRAASKFVNYKSMVSLCILFLLRNCLSVVAKDVSATGCNVRGENKLTDCTDTSGYRSSLYGLTNKVTRPKFFKSRIPYTVGKGCSTFQIQDMSLQLLVSGDVQTNPGPVKNPCSVCGKSASVNHRKLICSGCKLQCHIGPKCGNISQHQYTQFQSQVSYIWHCPKCLHQGDLNIFQTQEHHVQHFEEIDDSLIDLAPDMFEELRNSLGSKGRGIRIAHLNVRGLLSKFNEIILLIKESNMDILMITESHLDRTVPDEQIAIDGFGLKRCDRNKHGGGVLVYFNNSLDITPFQNIDRLGTESIWMDLTFHSPRYLIAGIYRPPDKPEFYENLSSILEGI